MYSLVVVATYIPRDLVNTYTVLIFTQAVEPYMLGMKALEYHDGTASMYMTLLETRGNHMRPKIGRMV